MIAHHEAAAIVAAVTCCGSVVGGNENQTGGERDGNSGQRCSTRLSWEGSSSTSEELTMCSILDL